MKLKLPHRKKFKQKSRHKEFLVKYSVLIIATILIVLGLWVFSDPRFHKYEDPGKWGNDLRSHKYRTIGKSVYHHPDCWCIGTEWERY